MANLAKEIVLITGANSGIGFEIARQFLARGTYHVLLGARSSSKGSAALKVLQSQKLPGSIELLQLDVRSDDDINNAEKSIAKSHGKLDILVNNAAVALPEGNTVRERLQIAFDTNAAGPYILAETLIPLLRKSTNPRIINISSGAGSIGRRLLPESAMYKIQGMPYRTSKVAFNMMSACLYVEHGLGIEQMAGWEHEKAEDSTPKMKVFCYDPGFTVSNLGPHNTAENGARSAEETVKSIMEVVDGKRDGEQGQFIHNTGGYPW